MRPSVKWAFMRPWVEMLLEHLTDEPKPGEGERLTVATFRCWTDERDELEEPYVPLHEKFYVRFPADHANRVRQTRCQRIREALELLDMVSAVNNAAFSELMNGEQVTEVEVEISDDVEKEPLVVCPLWVCYLSEHLDDDDPVASMPAVSWGMLFGCSNSPADYSPEFRAAMLKIKRMGVEEAGKMHNTCGAIEWWAYNEAMRMHGTQGLVGPRYVRWGFVRTETMAHVAEPLACHLGKMLEYRVPHVAQLCAFEFWGQLVETWRQSAGADEQEDPASVGDMYGVDIRYSENGMAGLVAALAQTNSACFTMLLQDFAEDFDYPQTISHAGALFSTLMCGHSICKFDSAENDVIPVPRRGSIERFSFDRTWDMYEVLNGALSALAEVTHLEMLEVSLDDGEPVDLVPWMWLAYALWSKWSRLLVRNLIVFRINLSQRDFSAIEAVVKNSYPRYPERPQEPQGEYGFIDLHEGTSVIPYSPEGIADTDTALVLARAWRCRAYYDPLRTRTHADVIVPGYGICKLDLTDGKHSFVPDRISWGRETANNNKLTNLTSLEISLKEVESDELVLRFLTLVGASLRELDLKMFMRERVYTVDLSKLAVVCPDLEKLILCNCNVSISDYNQALRNWGLKRLTIENANSVCNLASCLNDPTSRMARQLLCIYVITKESDISDSTRSNLAALEDHDGEYLPVTEMKFPLQCKIAMISVIEQGISSKYERSTSRFQVMSHMDSSVLSLIFAFAAKPAQRLALCWSSDEPGY